MRKTVLGVISIVFILATSGLMVSCAQKSFQSDQSSMYTLEKRNDDFSDLNTETQESETRSSSRTRRERMRARDAFLNEHIFFEFDSSHIGYKAQSILRKKANWLKDNPKSIIIIEGHCDDRGTEAYNLALGERRAEHAKNYLIDSGINTARLYTISYGEERPLDLDSTESAWSRNRRVSFVIQ